MFTPTGNRTQDKALRRFAPSRCLEGPHFTTKLWVLLDMRRVGFEPTRITPRDLKTRALNQTLLSPLTYD